MFISTPTHYLNSLWRASFQIWFPPSTILGADEARAAQAEGERTENEIMKEFKLMLGERPWDGYCHLKVNEEEGFVIADCGVAV